MSTEKIKEILNPFSVEERCKILQSVFTLSESETTEETSTIQNLSKEAKLAVVKILHYQITFKESTFNFEKKIEEPEREKKLIKERAFLILLELIKRGDDKTLTYNSRNLVEKAYSLAQILQDIF
jgi:hypothetical protein